MSEAQNRSSEVQPKPTRRTFTTAYKRRIVAEANECTHGDLGALLRREGLYYSQIAAWRGKGRGWGRFSTAQGLVQ